MLNIIFIWSIYTLAPPVYASVRLLLSTLSSTSLTTPLQFQDVLCKPKSNYIAFNGFKPARAIFMPIGTSDPSIKKKISTF